MEANSYVDIFNLIQSDEYLLLECGDREPVVLLVEVLEVELLSFALEGEHPLECDTV